MSKRVERVNQLIKKELSLIVLRELDCPTDVLITITRVETTDKIDEAKVFVSVLPDSKVKDVLDMLKRQVYALQQQLNKRLKMRPIPRIEFRQETRTVEAGKIEEVLAKLEKNE